VPNEDGTYNVILTSYGSSKLSVIKAVRDLLSVGLSEAKSICESLPYTLKSVKTYEEAENIKTVIVNAGGTVDIPNAPAQQQSGSCKVVLVSYGAKKLNVINALRSILGLSLIEAKSLCEKAPVTLKSEVTQKEAAEMKKAIEDAGGTVELR
jgi:large subunit ribosomal protein L7/L12